MNVKFIPQTLVNVHKGFLSVMKNFYQKISIYLIQVTVFINTNIYSPLHVSFINSVLSFYVCIFLLIKLIVEKY